MSDDLVTFLRARLDEDEELAKQADECGAPRWDSSADPLLRYGLATRRRLAEQGVDGALDGAVATHHARHDPARVLAEVEAKRATLAEYAEFAANDIDDPHEYAYGWASGLGLAVRHMVSTYADHPDYREEWRP